MGGGDAVGGGVMYTNSTSFETVSWVERLTSTSREVSATSRQCIEKTGGVVPLQSEGGRGTWLLLELSCNVSASLGFRKWRYGGVFHILPP